MKPRNFIPAVALAIVAGAIVVQSQVNIDVIGTWKMDASKSRFSGSQGSPRDVIIRFEREGSILRETLTVTGSSGQSTTKVDYSLDGKDLVNGANDEQLTSRARVEGDILVLEWNDRGGKLTRRFKLSADRQTLTVIIHDSNPEGEPDDLVWLEKR